MMYNLLLAKGINKVVGGQFVEGIEWFNKAGGVFAGKVEPYIYRAMASI